MIFRSPHLISFTALISLSNASYLFLTYEVLYTLCWMNWPLHSPYVMLYHWSWFPTLSQQDTATVILFVFMRLTTGQWPVERSTAHLRHSTSHHLRAASNQNALKYCEWPPFLSTILILISDFVTTSQRQHQYCDPLPPVCVAPTYALTQTRN